MTVLGGLTLEVRVELLLHARELSAPVERAHGCSEAVQFGDVPGQGVEEVRTADAKRVGGRCCVVGGGGPSPKVTETDPHEMATNRPLANCL